MKKVREGALPENEVIRIGLTCVCATDHTSFATGSNCAQSTKVCATVLFLMATYPQPPVPQPGPLYCPNCAEEVTDPLTCGDCSAVICRRCGTPLESPDELGIG
jgi:hypothetical protein